MILRKYIVFLFLFISFNNLAQNQYRLLEGKKSEKIRFELISNIIIIPVEVNGLPLKFLLDTGVSKPIVFNFLKASDSLKVLNAEKIKLKGLGDGDYIEALRSSQNIFKIGNAVNKNQTFFAIFDSSLNFAPKLGIAIHGIIGYDLFKDFIVEINYSSKYIRLYNPEQYRYKSCRKCETFDLEFKNDKPYLNVQINDNQINIDVKLLIDSGSSDALWLFEDKSKNLTINKKYFNDFLGTGLSGNVFGKRTKIDELKLKRFTLKRSKVAFPDSIIVASVKKFKDRDGTLGGEILKRFNCIVDYSNSKITLKPNRYFSKEFSYNKSGLQIEHNGVKLIMEIDVNQNKATIFKDNRNAQLEVRSIISNNYRYAVKPTYVIYNVIEKSPADIAGLRKGDIIFYVNGKSTTEMTLQELVNYFYQKSGTRIKLVVNRYGMDKSFEFKLKSPID